MGRVCQLGNVFHLFPDISQNWIKHYKLVKLGKLINLLSQHWRDMENQIMLEL